MGRLYIRDIFGTSDEALPPASPVVKSKFKQLQITGREAELYFIQNFPFFGLFKSGILEDASLLGDGYDFQIQINSRFPLAEVKGLPSSYGAFGLRKTNI